MAEILPRNIEVYLGPRGDAIATCFDMQLVGVTYLLKSKGQG